MFLERSCGLAKQVVSGKFFKMSQGEYGEPSFPRGPVRIKVDVIMILHQKIGVPRSSNRSPLAPTRLLTPASPPLVAVFQHPGC